jgi:hypothetical protein
MWYIFPFYLPGYYFLSFVCKVVAYGLGYDPILFCLACFGLGGLFGVWRFVK